MGTDYRSEKMASAEGERVANGRFSAFLAAVGRDNPDDPDLIGDVILNPPYKLHTDEAHVAKHISDLVGFWVTWHLAGGFQRLELAGWHRATIFRKVKNFRDFFGEHPDTYKFPWITLDPEMVWGRDVLLHDSPLRRDE